MAALSNPFLQGNYAPVTSETTYFDLAVQGRVPVALNGIYVRTGPNAPAIADPQQHHAFNGLGMLHAVAFVDGRASWYKARWLRPRDCEACHAQSPAALCATGNSNVFVHAGRVYAIDDGATPIEFDRALATVGRGAFADASDAGINSHPLGDPRDGSLHTLAYDHEHASLRYRVFDARGRLRTSAPIALERPIMAHSFLLTERFLVLFDLPVVLDMESALAGEPAYRWNPRHTARIGLAPRNDPTRVEWFPVAPCFVLHGFNAYDEGDDVVIDVVAHERMFDRCRLGPGEANCRVVRWRVLPRRGRVIEDVIDATPQEFPTRHPGYVGRRYRYGYAIAATAAREPRLHFTSNLLIKHDFQRAERRTLDIGAGWQASELSFVPRPGSRAEDDGWLLGFAYDTASERSQLLVISAARFEQGCLARIDLPRRVPFGFHGAWLPQA